MQFRFDANQEYQLQAIEAVTDLLDGQLPIAAAIDFSLGSSLSAVPNRLELTDAELLANLQSVQCRHRITPDDALRCIEETIRTVAGEKTVCFPNFSVEMETGTGKTYIYLRTALELYQRYGLCKFIVVVPSVAIREGVLKTLQVTEQHLRELYGNTPYRYYVYDSANLSQVRQFALSDAIEIMVMTIDSFNKSANVIRQSTDRLQGETPIHLVQAARPILILDEPQNMESELRVKALAALDPLFALRYSATHRNPYNVVYRLTPFDAYRQGLVKRIEVASVIKEHDANQVYLRLLGIEAKKKTLTARIALHALMKDGTVKEKTVTVRPGEGLEAKANRPEYAGYEIDEINAGFAYVRFTNEVELSIGEAKGADKDAIFAAQIEETIHKHFEKQHRLRERGIKVLSLFFIDRVDNYAPADGMIRRLFSETFDRLKVKHPAWAAVAPGAVQASYFAQKKRKGGEMEMLDSTSGKNEADIAAYNLIMREKEKLLSFDEPVSFIFSHSALREGWDNPNVFQICTLNQTSSEMKKRQEVGRGVRLCVNQHGERVLDEHVNVLTVIANESYERYVDTLQQEIEVEYGKAGVPPKPPRAERPKALLRKARALSPEFQALWERIKQKTRYAVQIDTERLIGEVVYHLQLTPIRPPRVSVTTASVGVVGGNQFEARQMTGARTAVNLAGRYMLPNLMQIMVNMLEHTTPSMRVSRRTLIAILRRVIDKRCVVDNPHDFATVAVKIIKERLADHLVNGIRYQRINAWYEMAQILGEEEIEIFGQYIVPTSNDNALYDHIACDSLVEQQFVHDLEHRQDVKLYLKLPSWFTVPTPVGEYNPDWAIVMDTPDGDRLYLVRETKSAGEELRPTEKRKTLCGERHFQGALGVSYKIVSSAREL